MSAFAVNLTPTRLKFNKKRNDAREPTDVILAPFSAKATVTFEEIPVTKTARRILNIYNPSDDEIKVMVTKCFKPEHNMSLEWTRNVIPAHSQITMDIVWNPLVEISCKETIQLTDNRNFKKDIAIILKAIQKPKTGTKRFPNVSSGIGPAKTLKLKSPTGKMHSQQQQHQRKRQSHIQQQNESNKLNKQKPLLEINDFDFVVENYTVSSSQQSTTTTTSTNKENVSPLTPNNMSSVFDNIKFTPATETKTKGTSHLDYLASLPTPNTIRDNTKKFDNFVRPCRLPIDFSPEQTTPTKTTKIINFESTPYQTRPIIPDSEISHFNSITDKLSPSQIFIKESESNQSTTRTKLSQTQTINKTFDIKTRNNETLSISLDLSHEMNKNIAENSENILEKVNISGCIENYTISNVSSRLSVIEEEATACKRSRNSENDLNIVETTKQKNDDTLKRDIKLVGTPLRKYSESMRDLSLNKNTHYSLGIQGSMPNLNNMETIQSIEQNRYFNYAQSVKTEFISPTNRKHGQNLDLSNCSSTGEDNSLTSTISAADLAFNQSEILAASSRFNIHETGRKKCSPFAKRDPKTSKNQHIQANKSFINNAQHSKQQQKRSRENDSPNSLNYMQVPKSIHIAVSPPKRTKLNMYDDVDHLAGSSFRTQKWGHVQPKKLRIQKTLSLVRKPITPHKIKLEPERQPLFDNNLILRSYINPDPFAATTICDPFLSHTIYLDEYTLSNYESQMKKCLNALVSMPAELDPDCDDRIDVGKIFNEVRNKELILAPTKEEQSMTYLTKARMGALRAAAFRLYVSDEMCSPCGKVAVYIKKGAIKIRPDRDLHLDVVMQRNILELLLCFNPLWLRIGLEVVFNEEIHLHSNSDIIGLSTFILNRLFKDKFMERKYSKAFTLSDEYSNHIKTFSLQKILFLLLFLDKAKNNRIIKHNPCLFVKKSKHKETRDILLRFSSELLASVGDITRELKRMGYVLTHKQIFIDEFDYAFKNLAVDLRDGIRLTRVMEIILLRDDLTKQLRCPAISRLQRIFNVNLGLKALTEAEFDLKGNITAADIVDGHREKTLSLLWQIIYKFRAPKFIAAATVLQKWWRNSWLKVIINRRIKYKEQIRKMNSAIIIQSAFRSYIARKYVQVFKWERTNAAICLQKYCRRLLAIKRLRTTLNSIVFIQRWYRTTKLKIIERTKYIQIRNSVLIIQYWYRRLVLARKIECAIPIICEIKAEAKLKYTKAIILQRSIKSFIIHKKLQSIVNGFIKFNRRSKLQFRSATKIQSLIKMIPIRREFLLKRCAAIKIQKHWKSYVQMRIERARFIGKRQAAMAIQKQFKSYKLMQSERENYIKLRENILIIQKRFRANKLCKIQCEKYQKIRQSVITIQEYWRSTILMRKVRAEYINNRQTIIRTQQIIRGNREMRLQYEKFILLKNATITVQRKYRTIMKMRLQKIKYEKLRSSTIVIQRKLRATLLSRKIRLNFIQLQYNATLMQQRFRANRLMQKEREKYLQLKRITVSTQRRFRANLLKHKVHSEFLQLKLATITIQQQYRNICLMRTARYEYLKLKNATYLIQQQFRALCAMRKKKTEYLELKKSTIFIQRKFRANKLMKLQRTEYSNLQQACVLIQTKFKANYLMRTQRIEYLKLKKSAVKIQQCYRAFYKMRSAKTDFLQLKQATKVIQQKFRAISIMRKTRNHYLKMKNATIYIQQKYRAICSKKIAHKEYNDLKKSTITIQQQFRALIMMRQQRTKYLNIIKSICIIQVRFRALVAMRKERQEYLKLKSSTITIQQRYRAILCMRFQRNKYDNLKLSTLVIQHQFRAICAMRKQRFEYIKLKQATVIIQQKYRAYLLMKTIKYNYNVKRNAVILIQRKFRAYLEMKKALTKYKELRQSAITIQIYFRAYKLMKIQREHFINEKSSAIKIQKWYRSLQVMWHDRNNYRCKIQSIRLIQQRYRSTIQKQHDRSKYLQIRQSTIKIQQFFRSYIQMKSEKCKYLELKRSVIIIQQKYRAKLEMLEVRNQYLLIYSLIVCIQSKFRAKRQMKIERENFLKIKSATIMIQQIYRAKKEMHEKRKNYLELKQTILTVQTYSRGFLARKHFNSLMTPEMKELIRRKRAAKIIQRYWRGYRVRRKFTNLKIALIRERIKELKKTASLHKTVKYKISASVKFLKGRFNVQEALSHLLTLENMSRTVPHLLMDYSSFISTFCYGIMAQAIRSEADKQVIEYCSRIILNLARFNSTTANIFQEHGLVTIAQMLLRWCDKDCGIFNTLCTLVWIFAHCPVKKQKIRKFMSNPEEIYLLRETKKMVLRKDKMRQNVRKLSVPTVVKNTKIFSPKALPSLEPDFGVIRAKPYTFINSVFAFEVVLAKLGIEEVF